MSGISLLPVAVDPLLGSEDRFRLLLDALGDFAVYMLDRRGYVASWNSGAERAKGYSTDEILGRHFAIFFPPEDCDRGLPQQLLDEAARLDRAEAEGWRIRRNGTRFWGSSIMTTIRDRSGFLLGYAVVTRDQTDRWRANEALAASERKFRDALNYSPIGMALVSLMGEWLEVNDAVCEMLGYTRSEMRALTFQEVTHPDDLATDLDYVGRLLAGEIATFQMEKRYLRKDGSAVWGLLAVSLVRDHEGKPLHFISQIQNVDLLKRTQQVLHRERDRLEVTLYSIADGVVATDPAGAIEFMNAAAERLTGWTVAEVLGRPATEVIRLVDAESGGPVACPVAQCLERRQVVQLAEDALLQERNGATRDIRGSAAPVGLTEGQHLGVVLVMQDVSQIRAMQRELRYNATHDALTGLPNRRKFKNGLDEALESARGQQAEHVLVFLDLDRFKIVNDTAGHAAGDAFLRQVAQVVTGHVRQSDLVARLGGDEFGILLLHCSLEQGAPRIERLIAAIAGLHFPWEGRIQRATASAGVTVINAAATSVTDLMRQADVACYAAKSAGRNRVSIYGQQYGDAGVRHRELQMAAELREALAENRFRLFAQRIVPVSPESSPGAYYELLLRMLDRNGVLLGPGHFIPAAERYDLMADLDRWVLDEVLSRRGPELARIPDLQLSLNISGNSLNNPTFLPSCMTLVERSAFPARRLTMEITETALINNIPSARALFEGLRRAGGRVALDDLGVGLSSFSYLKSFEVDLLKIDGSFVRGIGSSPVDRAIVAAIASIAREIRAQTIAECVEERDILPVLEELQVDMAQGYALDLPRALDEVLAELVR